MIPANYDVRELPSEFKCQVMSRLVHLCLETDYKLNKSPTIQAHHSQRQQQIIIMTLFMANQVALTIHQDTNSLLEDLVNEISQAQGDLKGLDKRKALERVTSEFTTEKSKRKKLVQTLKKVKLIQETSRMKLWLT